MPLSSRMHSICVSPECIDYGKVLTMAKDKIHDSVIQALKNDGWMIVKEQFHIYTEQGHRGADFETFHRVEHSHLGALAVYYEELEIRVDVAAERPALVAEKEGRRILVEIKTFGGRSFIKELQHAVGQYKIYKDILALAEIDYELFLAIHESIYEAAFQRKATSQIVQMNQLKLLIVDVDRKEITKWIK